TRGVNLAVITFGLGFAIFQLVFSNSDYTGGSAQTHVSDPHFLGVAMDPIVHQRSYAALCLIALLLAAAVVTNPRRSRSGRRLLAVRSIERAAAALGVNVYQAKLYAFTISAGLAGLGGVLLGFSYPTIIYQQLFTPDGSIAALVLAVIGGIGYVLGPVVGSVLASGGIATLFFGDAALTDGSGPVRFLPLATGILLLLTLVASQNGIVDRAGALLTAAARRRVGRAAAPGSGLPDNSVPTGDLAEREMVPPRVLQ